MKQKYRKYVEQIYERLEWANLLADRLSWNVDGIPPFNYKSANLIYTAAEDSNHFINMFA